MKRLLGLGLLVLPAVTPAGVVVAQTSVVAQTPVVAQTSVVAQTPTEAVQPPPASPAPAPVSSEAVLDSLVRVALERNPRIQAAESTWRASEERVPQAGALADPMLSVTSEGAPIRNPSPTNAPMAKIGVTQMFEFPGKQGAMRRSMAEMAAMQREELTGAQLEVAADVRRAWYDLYALQRSIDILEQNLESTRLLAGVARSRYEVGAAGQQDVLRGMVETSSIDSRLAVLRAQIPAARARLNLLLDQPADAPLPVARVEETVIAAPAIELLEAQALEQQPMLAAQRREVASRRASLALARKAGLPDFTVGLEYMADKEMDDSWMGMIGVTLPIWRGSKVGPARREAEAELAAAQGRETEARNEAIRMVREEAAMLESQRATVELYRGTILPQADLALASARTAYENGRADFLTLLDAQRFLFDSQTRYAQALADQAKSLVDLRLAAGDRRLLGERD
ncbi:MAG: TolC family protein [Candidatus Eisenbacteria bacterium]